MSKLEERFLLLLTQADPSICVERQVMVIPGRKFRFDFALPEHKILVEIQGGTFSGGRHTRGYGYEADTEKSRLGQMQGWDVLCYTGKQITEVNIKELVDYAREKQT